MFYIGLDLGRSRDHSAIAVVERIERLKPYGPSVFHRLLIRHLERVPLGTPYTAVVAQIREIVQHPLLRGQCALVVDGTGVGAPVVDSLRAARLGCELSAVTITGGEHANGNRSVNGVQRWNVPKRDLI